MAEKEQVEGVIVHAKAALGELEKHPSNNLGPSGHAAEQALKTVLGNQLVIAEVLQSILAGTDGGRF